MSDGSRAVERRRPTPARLRTARPRPTADDRASDGYQAPWAQPGAPLGREQVIDLQHLAGNRALAGRLIVARDPAPGTPPGPPAGTPPQPDIAWIDSLPGEIQTQIDTFSDSVLSKLPAARQAAMLEQRTANRITFMNTMRALFGTDAATQAHFGEIQAMGNDPKYPLWAHVSTRERLLEAQADLKSQNTPMPQTDVALGLRGDHLHPEGKSAGWFTHATGFAIDWKAHAAPHITDPRLIELFKTVTGGTPHIDLNTTITGRLDVIEKMGQGKATPAESQAFLGRLESEYNRLVADSQKFKTDLPETSLAPLRAVEDARTAVGAARGKLRWLQGRAAKKADITAAADVLTTAVATFDAAKKDAEAHLTQIFEPWTKLLDRKIAAIDKAAADQGVDLGLLTGTYGFKELSEKAAALKHKQSGLEQSARKILAEIVTIQRDALALIARIEAAKAWLAAPGAATLPAAATGWSADLDVAETDINAAIASLDPAKAALATILPGAVLEPKAPAALRPSPVAQGFMTATRTAVDRLPARATTAAAKVSAVADPLAKVIAEATGNARTIAERTAYRAEKVTALGGGTDRAAKAKGEKAVGELLQTKIQWLNLKGAKQALQTNAEEFVFKSADVLNPAITQLLGLTSGTRGGGVFTPDAETGGEAEAKAGKWSDTHGFNLAFMKAMVSHGFELGVAWQGQSDTMHFELVEGRRLLESGGTRALTAGAGLRASEAAAKEP